MVLKNSGSSAHGRLVLLGHHKCCNGLQTSQRGVFVQRLPVPETRVGVTGFLELVGSL